MKKRLNCKNALEVALKLIDVYNDAKSKTPDKTHDVELADLTKCPLRVLIKGVYRCGKSAPRTVKLTSLKICQVCQIMQGVGGKKGGQTQTKGFLVRMNAITKSGRAYTDMVKRNFERIKRGEIKVHCDILKDDKPILEVPCVEGFVKTWGGNPMEKMNCRYPDCEERVKRQVKIYYDNLKQKT